MFAMRIQAEPRANRRGSVYPSHPAMTIGSTHRNASADDAPRVVERAANELAARLDALATVGASIGDRAFMRIETPVEPTDLLQWLRGAPAGGRRYFRDRSTKCEIAGIGAAVTCAFGDHEDWTQLPARASTGADRASAWFVALPFDAERMRDGAWSRFAGAPCTLPEVELRRDGDQHGIQGDGRLACPDIRLQQAMHRPVASKISHDFLHRVVLSPGESKRKQTPDSRIDLGRIRQRSRSLLLLPHPAAHRQTQLEFEQIVEQDSPAPRFVFLHRFRQMNLGNRLLDFGDIGTLTK